MEYITYRKCKFIQEVNTVRLYLHSRLNGRVLSNLMLTLENIMASYGSRGGIGYEYMFILQMVLLNPNTSMVNFKHLRLWHNLGLRKLNGTFLHHHMYDLHYNDPPAYMETRIESTLIQYALNSADKLTHIQMQGAANDTFCKVISEVCENVQYLDISDSFVSDQGLYYLAGVTEEENRTSRYPRYYELQNIFLSMILTNGKFYILIIMIELQVGFLLRATC